MAKYSLVVTSWGFYAGGYALVVLACLVIFYLSGDAQPVRMFNFFAQTLYLFVASVGIESNVGSGVNAGYRRWHGRILL